MAIKLFELDIYVREPINQLGLAYNTVDNFYQILRYAIVISDTKNQFFW